MLRLYLEGINRAGGEMIQGLEFGGMTYVIVVLIILLVVSTIKNRGC